MTARTWTDQPLVCEACSIVCTIPVSRGSIEIRAMGGYVGGYYLTCGSLFGSETIFCPDVDALLRALNTVTNTPKGKIGMPEGCHLVEDGKPPMEPDGKVREVLR